MQEPQTLTLLVVEDDPGHARLIEKNLRRSSVSCEIVKLTDGQQILDYLLTNGKAAESVVVLLDLNMPGLSGYQVLQRLKAHERTRAIPVVILTTTDDSAEIKRCYDLGCNAYVTKPVDYEQFSEMIHRLGLFLTIVRTPEG
ncbi:MAG TPA: response regulator [Bryobacteraceae bacterium]|nr:response regulator [Bryobacteraceae bacterium]